ncbi:MAG: BlaI/MecI/CopY family transcriptional regulator [Sphingobacteriales bacterium]|nr:BlaI/MecI/CopY family transcriptional regulator [Sphingobacteriales bacterium]
MTRLLTPLELKVMNLLWKMKEAFVKQLVEKWQESEKPAYNTVSTTVRILEEKGFIQHKTVGRGFIYFPTISKVAYQKMHVANVLENLFAGSRSGFISALMGNDEKLSAEEISTLRRMIDGQEAAEQNTTVSSTK